MDDTRRRRIKVLSEHFSQDGYKIGSEGNPSEQTIAPEDCAGRSSDRSSEIYASATGRPNSYARIHGDVSRHPAQWKNITTVQKETLQETLYHKAHGEGIAKVRHTNYNPIQPYVKNLNSITHNKNKNTFLPFSTIHIPTSDHNQSPRKKKCLHTTNHPRTQPLLL
jgi:hypothetical protein